MASIPLNLSLKSSEEKFPSVPLNRSLNHSLKPSEEKFPSISLKPPPNLTPKKVFSDFPPPPKSREVLQRVEGIREKSEKKGRTSLGESICLATMESLFPNGGWKKVRPHWCRNPETGRCLELDVYSERLCIAVEYNGRQHYEVTDFYSSGGLSKQKYRDQVKKEACQREGVYLCVVPFTVPPEQIPDFIYADLYRSATR